MNVFISYSVKDLNLVQQIAFSIGPFATVYYWDQDKEPGKQDWESIFRWIDSSDLVLAIITGNTAVRAMAVGNEIGHAKAKGKEIIPIVTPEVPQSELGVLEGIIYQRIDRTHPQPALQILSRIVQSRSEKLDKQRAIFIVGLLIGGLILLSRN